MEFDALAASGRIVPGELEKLKEMDALLHKTLSRAYGDLFKEPVDPVALELPTYFDVVKNPMDIGTVRRKIREGAYPTAAACNVDVRLVWANAVLYNGESEVGNIAEGFAKRWEDLYMKINPDDLPTRPPINDERARLSRDFYRVDDNELVAAVAAVERGCPSAVEARCADSLIVNLDTMDARTFWEVDRFVRRCLDSDPEKARRNVTGCGERPRKPRY